MNTRLLLAAFYEGPHIPVADVARDWFGLSLAEARAQIAAGTFPVPVYQLRQSQKAPWFISLEDAAAYMEKAAAEAREAHRPATNLLQKARNARA